MRNNGGADLDDAAAHAQYVGAKSGIGVSQAQRWRLISGAGNHNLNLQTRLTDTNDGLQRTGTASVASFYAKKKTASGQARSNTDGGCSRLNGSPFWGGAGSGQRVWAR